MSGEKNHPDRHLKPTRRYRAYKTRWQRKQRMLRKLWEFLRERK